MRILIGICTNRDIKAKTLESLLNLVHYTTHELEFVIATRGYTVAENRNYCVVQAQRCNADYILFVDDDMTFPQETLDVLLSHGKDIVGVNSYSRILPLSPTTGLMNEKGGYKHPDKYPTFEMKIPEMPFKAYFVGTGVCLIKRSVFENIKKPWFEFEMSEDGCMTHGEDGLFCDKAREAGYEIWCDPFLEIGHIGTIEYGEVLEDKLKTVRNRGVIIFPIAFTIDNSETDFELEIEYREIAEELGFKEYRVCRCPNDSDSFVDALQEIYEKMK